MLKDTRSTAEQGSYGSIRGLSPLGSQVSASAGQTQLARDEVDFARNVAASIKDTEIDSFEKAGGVAPP
jgi:hypothetical protein